MCPAWCHGHNHGNDVAEDYIVHNAEDVVCSHQGQLLLGIGQTTRHDGTVLEATGVDINGPGFSPADAWQVAFAILALCDIAEQTTSR